VYSAAKGEGAWLGNKRLSVAPTPLSDSSMLMLTSNLLDTGGRCPNYAGRWIAQTNWKIRMLGSAALECIQVAAGVAHGAVTVNGKLWDVAAPAAVLLEAGGILTDLSGRGHLPVQPRRVSGGESAVPRGGAAGASGVAAADSGESIGTVSNLVVTRPSRPCEWRGGKKIPVQKFSEVPRTSHGRDARVKTNHFSGGRVRLVRLS